MNECRSFVLVFSAHSNASPQVLREIERAVSKGLDIVTVRIDDVPMARALEYFLSATHWLDATVDVDLAVGGLGAIVTGPTVKSPQPTAPVAATTSTPTPIRTNLPASVSTLIGRMLEIADVVDEIARSRMVTATGAGGSGKSRVALEAASRVTSDFPDGVWYVDIAEIDIDLGLALLEAMRVAEVAGVDAASTCVDELRPKTALVVFDNCEPNIDAVRALSTALLKRCHGVKILAASRHIVGVPGEAHYHVGPFDTIDTRVLPRGGAPLVEAAGKVAAVRLFVDRARSVLPSFALTGNNVLDVVEICNRLDCLPLAIELAAARVKVLAPDQIAARLVDRFKILGGNKGGHERHQTLRAALEWSIELLEDSERTLLDRLTVFAGPCTVDAVEAVCVGDPLKEWEILDLLTALVEKSMVRAEEWEGGYRYNILSSMRELRADAVDDDVRLRHRDWYLRELVDDEPKLTGAYQSEWLDRIDADRPNWLAALTFSLDNSDIDAAVRLAAAAGRYWLLRCRFAEATEWLARVIDIAVENRSQEFAKVLNAAGTMAWSRGGVDEAAEHFKRSLDLYRTLDDQPRIADLLNNLGNIALESGDEDRASTLLTEALATYRLLDDRPGISAALGNLALIKLRAGDHDAAAAMYAESLAIDREHDDAWGMASSLHGLGLASCRGGRLVDARGHVDESLRHRWSLGDDAGVAESLEALAEIAAVETEWERAVKLIGAASAIRTSINCVLPTVDRANVDILLTRAAAALGQDAFEGCRGEAANWSTASAVEYGLSGG